MIGNLEYALREVGTWLRDLAIVGPNLLTTAHLKTAKEAAEFAETPTIEEAADVLICVAAVAEREGWSINDLAREVHRKLDINRARTWEQQSDGTWQHIKEV